MRCAACGTELPSGSRFCIACGTPVSGAATPSSDKWIVGIVLGVVGLIAFLFVGGIIAAVAIPNFLNAVDRGKQKRTMADIRSVATAVETHAVQHDAYPVAESIEELRSQLEPECIQRMPVLDGWGHPLRVHATPAGYQLISVGKDGIFQGCDGGVTVDFAADICFADGEFVQWPEGTQR